MLPSFAFVVQRWLARCLIQCYSTLRKRRKINSLGCRSYSTLPAIGSGTERRLAFEARQHGDSDRECFFFAFSLPFLKRGGRGGGQRILRKPCPCFEEDFPPFDGPTTNATFDVIPGRVPR